MTVRALLAAVLVASCAAPAAAQSQDPARNYPNRAVRIIVPFPAGGTADLMPRILGEKLSQKWGQPVVIENRAGAGGNIGATAVYNADPDGYTLLATPPSPLSINPSLYPKLPFDAFQFVPVGIMGAVPNMMLVNPQMPVNTVQEFIAYAKANPGKLNYASQGSGTTSHLTAEMFKSMAGKLQIAHIPYKGTAPALTAMLSGEVDVMFDNLGVSLQHVRSGKLKPLGIASETRASTLPNVPTMKEALPGFISVTWFGVVAPPKTSTAIAEKVSAAIADALKLPEVQKRMVDLSAEPIGSTPAEMAAFMKQDADRWRQVIQSAGVKLD
jgi:tripartite-type tricarboxylate transporter receptor subunit TctC